MVTILCLGIAENFGGLNGEEMPISEPIDLKCG